MSSSEALGKAVSRSLNDVIRTRSLHPLALCTFLLAHLGWALSGSGHQQLQAAGWVGVLLSPWSCPSLRALSLSGMSGRVSISGRITRNSGQRELIDRRGAVRPL